MGHSAFIRELFRTYPEYSDFLRANKYKLISGDKLCTDAELYDKCTVRLENIKNKLSYDYPNTKVTAAEDLVLSWIEVKQSIEEFLEAEHIH